MSELLVVDDEPETASLLSDVLRQRGHHTSIAGSGEEAIELLAQRPFAAVLADVDLGSGISGLDLCRRVRDLTPDTPVVVVTGANRLQIATEALRAGAYDFVCKPVRLELLAAAISRALEYNRLRTAGRYEESGRTLEGVIGHSAAIRRAVELVHRVAASDATVLITGESGTGKERISRAIHDCSERQSEPFLAINCAAISPGLLESELFGHVRGAFTDAGEGRAGLFVRAGRGTLFLDEIGEMPLEMQPKLLRVLQSRSVRPVGGEAEVPVQCRILCATNRDLESEVAAGRFREDLYYRINVVEIPVPPLRDRGTDILFLAEHFLAVWSRRTDRPLPRLEESARRLLLDYDWPGNVRELQNGLERAVAISGGGLITAEDLPPRIRKHETQRLVGIGDGPDAFYSLAEMEMRYIRRVLAATNNNKTRAAEVLGIDRRSLHRRLAAARDAREATATAAADPEDPAQAQRREG